MTERLVCNDHPDTEMKKEEGGGEGKGGKQDTPRALSLLRSQKKKNEKLEKTKSHMQRTEELS